LLWVARGEKTEDLTCCRGCRGCLREVPKTLRHKEEDLPSIPRPGAPRSRRALCQVLKSMTWPACS